MYPIVLILDDVVEFHDLLLQFHIHEHVKNSITINNFINSLFNYLFIYLPLVKLISLLRHLKFVQSLQHDLKQPINNNNNNKYNHNNNKNIKRNYL